jgi:glycosyltransferase involved in cell wall biosynthesis
MEPQTKLLLIGNYPPPVCGWSMQIKFVADELRRRGHICEILNINENRKQKRLDCIDVQNAFDYLLKILRYSMAGYRLNPHVNAQSKKGYLLALLAVLTGRLTGRPALLTFHGGLSQEYFPRPDSALLRTAFRWLFRLAGGIASDSEEIREAMIEYGIPQQKIVSVPTFSAQYLDFQPASLPPGVEDFLSRHSPVFFCYVSFRPEYQLEMLRQAMAKFRRRHPGAGFIWLGFPAKELPAALQFVGNWPAGERQGLQLLGNLPHDQFLTLLSRCFACIRTPVCDGVAASVLESLALGIPVVASENGRRPAGALLYRDGDPDDLAGKLLFLTDHPAKDRGRIGSPEEDDNISAMADWLSGKPVRQPEVEVAHAR